MPDGVPSLLHKDILTFEEIEQATRIAVEQFGFDKIRLTGGEPTMRRGVVELVEMLSKIDGIRDFGMTTNGSRLVELAAPLKKAGLMRLNISLDSVDAEEYHRITGKGDLDQLFAGVEAAQSAGFNAIKINCVIEKSPDEPAAQGVAVWGKKKGFDVRYIRQMDLARGKFWQVIGGDGGNCPQCGRVRLSSTGDLFPCLFSDIHYNIRELGVEQAMRLAIQNKPEKGDVSHLKAFNTIGG